VDQVALPRALRRTGADIFLSPYYKGPIAAPCPVVLTVHDLYFIGYGGRYRPLRDSALTAAARLYARRARAIVTASEHSRRAVIERLEVDPSKVTTIGVAVGAEFVPTPLAAAARARYDLGASYVLFVGNFKPHKNVDGLLFAWASLPATLRAAHRLVLAGGDTGRRPQLEALARALRVTASVVFPGLVGDADLPGLYSACAAFVLPSLDEGFGLPAVEAMACGAPVIRLRSRGAAGGGRAGGGGRRRGREARSPPRWRACSRARASRRPATPRPRARVRLCARPHRRPRAGPPRDHRRSGGGATR